MKIDNNMIEYATDALTKTGIVSNGQYEKEFKGYIASLGPAIIQSGLLAAVLFYENKESGAEKNRHWVVDAIKHIINKKRGDQQLFGLKEKMALYIMEHPEDRALLKDITHAIIALKMALRMFMQKNNE